jgi:hypothetical protein
LNLISLFLLIVFIFSLFLVLLRPRFSIVIDGGNQIRKA